MPRRSDELSVFLKETLPSLPDAIDAITMSVVDVSRKRAGVAAHEDRRTGGTRGRATAGGAFHDETLAPSVGEELDVPVEIESVIARRT
jgi:hypothetical protein